MEKVKKVSKRKVKTVKKTPVVAIKHKQILDKMSDNLGKEGKKGTIKEAMVDVGYSKSYAESGHIGSTKTWEDLMEKYFNDEDVAKAEQAQMNAKKLWDYYFPVEVTDEQIQEDIESHAGCKLVRIVRGDHRVQAFFYTPDNLAIGKSLDRIYKLKKRYDNTITLKGKISQLSTEELEGAIAREVSEALSALAGEGEA